VLPSGLIRSINSVDSSYINKFDGGSANTWRDYFVRKVVFAIVVIGLLLTISARSEMTSSSPMIFDMRKSLPLDPNEAVQRDFYINAGINEGLKPGSYVLVFRQTSIHDPILNKQQGMLTVPIGRVQILHVDRELAVARAISELTNRERPAVDFEGIMIGDRIDLSTATLDAPKLSPLKTQKAVQAQSRKKTIDDLAQANPAQSKNKSVVTSNKAAQSQSARKDTRKTDQKNSQLNSFPAELSEDRSVKKGESEARAAQQSQEMMSASQGLPMAGEEPSAAAEPEQDSLPMPSAPEAEQKSSIDERKPDMVSISYDERNDLSQNPTEPDSQIY
jgi:hypothetical protein